MGKRTCCHFLPSKDDARRWSSVFGGLWLEGIPILRKSSSACRTETGVNAWQHDEIYEIQLATILWQEPCLVDDYLRSRTCFRSVVNVRAAWNPTLLWLLRIGNNQTGLAVTFRGFGNEARHVFSEYVPFNAVGAC